MNSWRQIFSWEVQPDFEVGDIVRFRSREAAARHMNVHDWHMAGAWCRGSFEIIRVTSETTSYFPGEIALVPVGWGDRRGIPPVFVVSLKERQDLVKT